jgi:transposase
MVAARLFALGKTNPEVAEACGVSLAAVKLWKRAWKEQGSEGLAAKPHPGPARQLSDDDLVRLEKLLLAGAHKAGFASELWTCARVAEVIHERFGVEYHPSHVWKILRKLGWSCQKPEQRARERDESQIEAWRKVEWPRIKKGDSSSSYHRVRR